MPSQKVLWEWKNKELIVLGGGEYVTGIKRVFICGTGSIRVKINYLALPGKNGLMNIDEKERNNSSWLRSLYDYSMGVLWLVVGVFFLFQKKFNYDLQLDPALTVIFGVSCLMYGLFRVYRGYKKN